jgi:hypothetical protein
MYFRCDQSSGDAMKVGQSTSNYYDLNQFLRSQPPASGSSAGTDQGQYVKGGALEPGKTPASLSGSLWMMQTKDDDTGAANDALINEFLQWSKMNPAERLRSEILESKGLDENSLQALLADQRKAVEDEIRDAIKQKFGAGDTNDDAEQSDGIGSAEAA